MPNLHSVAAKIYLLAILSVGALAGVGFVAHKNLKSALLDQKRIELRHEVDTVIAIAEGFRERAARGEMSEAEAQSAAREAMRPIRFGDDKNYFFVYTMEGICLLLPVKPQAEGTSLIGLKDTSGRLIVRDMLEVAKVGGGLYTYDWVKPGDSESSLKFSYVGRVNGWNWMVGTGFHVQDVDAALAENSKTTAIVGGAMVLIIAGLAFFVIRGVTGPLSQLRGSMDRLAGGDLEAAIDCAERRDEIGLIGRSIVAFRDLLRRRAAEEAEQDLRRRRENDEARRSALAGLAVEFDGTVHKTAGDIEGAAGRFEQVAEDLLAMSNDTRHQAETSARAGQTAQENVQAVSSAAEELSASIAEIVGQVNHAAEVTAGAVGQTSHATQVIHGLDEASAEIGKVVALIEEIAGQTNLLALNATIEAARAGDAGRGFAVVASEVKALAGQTSKATEEISRRIGVIQQATHEAVTATGSVGESIHRVSEISTAIASTLDQQNAAVTEISRAISETLGAVAGLADDMRRLTANATNSDAKSMEVAEAARRMRGDTATLQAQVERLMREFRAA
ncbi:MAG: methyl-accepting chemotaxis protein [Hyphomicrobiales bacterium]|nr:methyl-accepting chemotaxis protein [Hyphomicrobiales bacterium]